MRPRRENFFRVRAARTPVSSRFFEPNLAFRVARRAFGRYSEAMTDQAPNESRRGFGATMAPLRPLLPYALRQYKTIALAFLALLAAAGATLTLPVTVFRKTAPVASTRASAS
jgi:hypothetical protein